MSVRLLMSVVALLLLAALVYPIGLGDLIVPGFVLMVLTSYTSLLRNGLYAVQELGFEAIAVVLESVVLLGLILYGGATGQGLGYYVWSYAIQYAFSCAYFIVVLWFKRIAGVGFFVLAQPLTPLLLGSQFVPSEPALKILALALGIAFVNNAFIGALNASDRQSSFTWAAGWSVVTNLALNLLLIPTFGYLGASWATVATELVLGVVAWVLTRRHVGAVPVIGLSWRVIL